jgi:hypothetical protein
MRKTLQTFALLLPSLLMASGCTRGCSPVDSKTQAILDADKTFRFPPGFPPDPGEEGKKTLAGVDSDHDGIRDDVQRWIYARYPTDKKKQKALTQLAQSSLFSLRGNLNSEELSDWVNMTTKAIGCLSSVFGHGPQSDIEFESTHAKVVNTFERTQLYLKNDTQLSGSTLGGNYPDDGTACE